MLDLKIMKLSSHIINTFNAPTEKNGLRGDVAWLIKNWVWCTSDVGSTFQCGKGFLLLTFRADLQRSYSVQVILHALMHVHMKNPRQWQPHSC